MIILKSATESLRLITSAVGSTVDYSISWADITTTTFTPSTTDGNIVTNTTTTILGSPAGSTQRQVKLITITNIHASTSTIVTVHKYDSASGDKTYDQTPHVNLLAGEVMQYVDGQGWVYYSSTGAIKASQTAAGSDTQLQYNTNGLLAGNANLTYSLSGNDLSILGTDPGMLLGAITNEPAAPAATQLQIYSKAISGRMMPKWKAPSGVDTSFQANLGFNTIYLWTPNTAAVGTGTGFGTAWPACTGTITHPTVTAGMGQQAKVMQLTNVVTNQNQILGLTASTATLANVWRGSGAGLGGFFFQCRYKIMLIPNAQIRIFVGLTSTTTGLVAGLDVYTGDVCGFDHITTDNITTMSFVIRDNTTTTRATFAVPTLAVNNTYDATIYSQPGGSVIYYRLVDLLTGNTIIDTNTGVTGNTTLPRNTIFMGPQAQMSNGTANIVVTTVAIGINKLYLECDT